MLKVIISGHIIEVYEFEREPYVPDRKRENDAMTDYLLTGDKRVLEKEELPEWLKKELKKQKTRSNGTRSKNNFRRLVLSNFTEQVNFITLTYAENKTDIAEAQKDFDNFMKRLRRYFGKDFKYIVVTEFQKRGAIHFHMLADLGISWSNQQEEQDKENWFREEFWEHGWVDIKDVEHVDNLGAYMQKYMVKRMDDERLAGKKAYRSSQNMDRPLILKGEDAQNIINLYTLQNKKETFTNSYESEYLGNITYKEYNLKRTHNH